MKEHALQCQIVEYLRMKGYYCYAIPNGFYSGIKDKGKKFAYINKLKREGYLVGAPDLQVLLPKGKIIHLELKVGYNKLSIHQEAFRDKCEELGHKYHVIRSLEDVMELGL